MPKSAALLALLLCSLVVRADDQPSTTLPMQKKEETLAITCMPSLVATLWAKEEKKGAPLTKEEVFAIRDAAPAVAVPASKVAAIEESRGYRDINADHAWEDWQIARLDLMKNKRANQALVPTVMSVTPAADAPVAPATTAAHL